MLSRVDKTIVPYLLHNARASSTNENLQINICSCLDNGHHNPLNAPNPFDFYTLCNSTGTKTIHSNIKLYMEQKNRNVCNTKVFGIAQCK